MVNASGMSQKNKKACIVLPQADNRSHFVYVQEMARALSQDMDIFLVVEKKSIPPVGPHRTYVQRFSFFPLRVAENFLVLLYARFLGYRVFYIHYSFIAAINASIIARLSGGVTYYWNAGLPWNYVRSAFRERFEHVAYRLIHHLVTGAEALREGYSRFYNLDPKSIVVITNWIDVDAFNAFPEGFSKAGYRAERGIDADALVVLFIQRLAKRKGVLYLPRIAQALFRFPTATLLVAGEGPDRGRVEKEISDKNLAERVRFVGKLSNSEIQKLFAISDVFILPSEEEGSPHALIESLAASKPFVAFDVGGVRDMVGPELQEWVVRAEDIDAFIKQLDILVESAEARKIAGAVAHARAYAYDKPVVIAQFRKLLEGLLIS